MSLSLSNITPANLELSPCRVTYKGVDLGATSGNVVVKMTQTLADIKADQLGTTVIDKRVSGHKYQIDFQLDEVLNKDNWQILFPSSKVVTSGMNKSVYFDSEIGFDSVGAAGPLVLHPLSKPDTDKSEDYYFWLASSEASSDWTFSPSEQVKMKLTFNVYPDFSVAPPRFFVFGDPAVGLVPASAGNAVAGTGNTGTGTVGSIAVFSGVTKTETVSLLCVVPGANLTSQFYVKGSSSGPLGLATVGVSFSSPEIGFLITAGGTNFATNDSFTIATIGANYS